MEEKDFTAEGRMRGRRVRGECLLIVRKTDVGRNILGKKNGGAACDALLRHSVQLRGKLFAEAEGYGDV